MVSTSTDASRLAGSNHEGLTPVAVRRFMVRPSTSSADSNEVARGFRDDVAIRSGMMSPWERSLAGAQVLAPQSWSVNGSRRADLIFFMALIDNSEAAAGPVGMWAKASISPRSNPQPSDRTRDAGEAQPVRRRRIVHISTGLFAGAPAALRSACGASCRRRVRCGERCGPGGRGWHRHRLGRR